MAVNDLFEKSLDKNRCKNVKIDPLLTYVTMDCEKNYIFMLSSMDIVKEIGIVNTDNEIEIQETIFVEESETEQTTNDKYIVQPPNVSNNSGSGIKIGVIEGDAYNPDATHLKGLNIINYISGTSTSHNHATEVLSILCGTSQSKDGIQYGGIAPAATIFFVNTEGYYPKHDVFHWLIVEKDVSIINMSFKKNNEYGGYNESDRYLDCLTLQYRVAFVKSAGNTGASVTAPGMAYNVITVGNICNEKDENGRYLVDSSSSYYENSWLTNKPDVCAFGTNIYMLHNGEETNFGSGTSFSTPMVSGAIALMMAENNNLIGKPDAIKAILINTANSEIVSQDGNNSVYDDLNLASVCQMREKSGAGLLNIEGAVSMARSNLIHRYAIPRTSTLANATKTTGEYYFEEGQVIEFTLVFEKPFDNKIASLDDVNVDFEIELYRYDECVMSSESDVNNVESFKVTIEESGYYYFRIRCDKLNSATESDFKDENENSLPHTSHNYFYVSFVLSCGCDLPSVEFDEAYAHSKYGHNLKCGNCNSRFYEEHDYKSITQHYDEADVTYGVYYKVHPLSVSNSESYPVSVCVYRDDLTPTVETTNSENTAIAILNSSYIEYQNEKYWELLSYEIIVLSPTNETVASYISTVYVNIYYETGDCNFDPSV
ncbi:MAG: S8 family serine peptidase [Clostridia bacterium]|nr:S8 family serine peptidase [Clostridia bacterium]